MPEQQAIGIINWQTVLVALVTATVTAWVTAWVNNRYERGRLIQMWKLQRSQERLDSVKEHVHRYIQDVAVINAVRGMPHPTAEQKAAESEALLDSCRAAISAASISQSMRDEQLSAAGDELQSAIGQILRGNAQQRRQLSGVAGNLLRRCDELVAEADQPWWGGFFGR